MSLTLLTSLSGVSLALWQGALVSGEGRHRDPPGPGAGELGPQQGFSWQQAHHPQHVTKFVGGQWRCSEVIRRSEATSTGRGQGAQEPGRGCEDAGAQPEADAGRLPVPWAQSIKWGKKDLCYLNMEILPFNSLNCTLGEDSAETVVKHSDDKDIT